MGYKAIKNINIKQSYRKVKKTTRYKIKNSISNKEKQELKSLIDNINDEKVKKNIQKFANSFFTNLK